MQAIEVVFTSVGTAIGLTGIVSPFVLRVLNKRDTKINLLEQKNELLEKANHKLELQNLELRLSTGKALTKLFSQLPAVEEVKEETP